MTNRGSPEGSGFPLGMREGTRTGLRRPSTLPSARKTEGRFLARRRSRSTVPPIVCATPCELEQRFFSNRFPRFSCSGMTDRVSISSGLRAFAVLLLPPKSQEAFHAPLNCDSSDTYANAAKAEIRSCKKTRRRDENRPDKRRGEHDVRLRVGDLRRRLMEEVVTASLPRASTRRLASWRRRSPRASCRLPSRRGA